MKPPLLKMFAFLLGLGVPVTFPLAVATAHEYWISLERGQLQAGEPIVADLKVGEHLSGTAYPYLGDRYVSFRIQNADGQAAVESFEGDLPAVRQASLDRGLNIVAQQTIAFRLTYDDPETFRAYLAYEGLDHILAEHEKRGLAQTGFSERYTRYAKALVQVGPASTRDADRFTGLPFEVVAIDNPYTGRDKVRVQLLWQGKPLGNAQINVFHAPSREAKTEVRTDAEGRAEIPLQGDGEYLLNAVHMLPVEGAPPVAWESHWASLSFRL